MITLQLQEFIIEQQDSIYSKMEPLMFSHLYKYKTNVGCLNYILSRIFHTTSFHKKARDMYCSQEIEKVSHTNDIEIKTNMLKKINTELKELYKENKLLQKVKSTIEDTELRKKMEQLIERKLNIREDLINSRSSVDDTKKLLKAYRTNQNVEKIHNSLNKNARIENELGIRDFESFNVSDLEKKEDAIKSYNYLYNLGSHKVKDIDKLKYDVVNHTQELYYPDEYYDIDGIVPACKLDLELGLTNNSNKYASSISSFSYSSDSDSIEERYVKKRVFNRIRRETAKNDIAEENNIKFKENVFLDNGEEMEEVELKDENEDRDASINSEEQINLEYEEKKKSSTSFLSNFFGVKENINTDSDSDINDKV